MKRATALRVSCSSLLFAAALGGCTVAAAPAPWARASAPAEGLLPAEQAFRLLSAERSGDQILVSWAIAPGYYLYRKRLSFEVLSPAGQRLGTPLLPKGERVADEREGSTEVYRAWLKARLPLASPGAPVAALRVGYQGCADAGVCYPPVNVSIDVTAPLR